MSGGGVKHFFEQPAAEDSRVFAQLGRTFHIPALTAEAKHNEQNPGRAITKAGINAALWYLGSEAGDALGAGGAASGITAGAEAGDESAGLAMNALQGAGPYADEASQIAGPGLLAGGGSQVTTEQLQQLGMQNMSQGGLLGSGSGSVTPTNLMQMAQPAASNTPLTQAQLMQLPASPAPAMNLNSTGLNAPVGDLSAQAQNPALRMAQDYAARYANGARNMTNNAVNGAQNMGRGLLGQPASGPAAEQASAPVYDASIRAASSGNPALKNAAFQMGMKSLTPQQRQPMPQGRPAPAGPQGPLTNPYSGGDPFQGNSMQLTEEQKQRLRAMGYQV